MHRESKNELFPYTSADLGNTVEYLMSGWMDTKARQVLQLGRCCRYDTVGVHGRS